MEIEENTVIKSLKRNLETSLDKILSKHTEVNDDKELPEEEFDNIVNNIMKSKEINVITRKFCDYSACSDQDSLIDHLDKSDLYDEKKLNSLLHQLNHNKTPELKLNHLRELLNYSVVDLAEKGKWTKLSKVLKDCLLSRNKEIFSIALNIHIKFANNSQTIIDGTSNLIKTLTYIFQSKKICAHSGSINLQNVLQEQITKLVNLLLGNFRSIFKNFNPSKEKLAEGLIHSFLDLASIHILYERSDYIHFMYYVFILDPKAKWFKQLLFTLHNRKIIIGYFSKNPAFIKYILKEFKNVTAVETEIQFRKSLKTDIPLDVIKFAALHHCSNIISTLMSYKRCHKLLPIEISTDDNKPCIITLVTNIIDSISNLNNLSKQKYKRNVLCETLKVILMKNYILLYSKDIVNALLKPFLLKIYERQRLSEIVRNNNHILHIINEVSKMQDGIFIIFGFTSETQVKRKSKYQYIRSISLQEPFVVSSFIQKIKRQHHRSASEKDNTSFGKIITEFTTNFIRHQLNIWETMNSVDEQIYELLECCSNIHALHSHSMFIVNSARLLEASLQFYRILIDRNLLINAMNPLLKYFLTICSTKTGTDYFMKTDAELLYILCKHYFFILNDNLRYEGQFAMFFLHLGSTLPGCIAIAECRRQIITPFLNRIWKLDEDQLLFLSGSERVIDEEVFKYIKFIFTMQFNFNCVQALLTNDADDESTLVDIEQKPSSLKDLIDETLITTGPGTLSCYVGLLTIRFLINNLNILVFLENIVHLQEELKQLQSYCCVSGNDKSDSQQTFILDECSVLRQNIIDYIQTLGAAHHLTQTKKRQLQSSSPPSAQYRRLNDFQRFLNESRSALHDLNWLIKARNILKQTSAPSLRVCSDTVFVDLIQQIRLTIPNTKNNYIWPDNEQHLHDLFPEDYFAISIIIKFGKKNNILQLPLQYEDILAMLMKQVYSFLHKEREKFDGFDWFVAIIFLICAGNIEKTKIVLQCLTNLPVSLYIWPVFSLQVGKTKNFNFLNHFDHCLNLLIGDLEIFKPALENSNVSWNFIVHNWINQCFFNILEWNELCNFLVVSILYPIDYVLFFFVCCAQHLETKLLGAINSSDLNFYQHLLQLDGLHISACLNSMDQLGKQYKNILSSRL